jgi:hypothetical protein
MARCSSARRMRSLLHVIAVGRREGGLGNHGHYHAFVTCHNSNSSHCIASAKVSTHPEPQQRGTEPVGMRVGEEAADRMMVGGIVQA